MAGSLDRGTGFVMIQFVMSVPNSPESLRVGARWQSGMDRSKWSSHSGPVCFSRSSDGRSQTSAMASHRSRAWGHRQNTWKVSSSSWPQIGHKLDVAIHLLARFRWIETTLRQIFHAKTLTFGGTGQLHITFHAGREPSGLALVAPQSCACMERCRASL